MLHRVISSVISHASKCNDMGKPISFDYKYRLMQHLSEFMDGLYKKPKLRNLFWEATAQCNLSCKHCGSSCDSKMPEDSLTSKEMCGFFYQLSNDFSPNEVMIYITGGEPLLRPDLFDVMEQAAKLGFFWGMTTNGTLLTDSIIERMIQTNCKTLSVSLDGLEQSHNYLRDCDCFDEVIKNINKLVATERFSNIQVTSVIHKSNIHELRYVHELLESLDVDSWKLTNIEPIGRANQMKDIFLSANEFVELFEFVRACRQNPSKIHVAYGCSHYATLEYERDIRDHYYFCGTGIITASILYNGDIYVCPDVERRNDLIQGNIREDNFSEVWHNRFKQFRVRRDKRSSTCIDCDDAFFCRGDSTHTWDFDENIPKCCLKQLLDVM